MLDQIYKENRYLSIPLLQVTKKLAYGEAKNLLEKWVIENAGDKRVTIVVSRVVGEKELVV